MYTQLDSTVEGLKGSVSKTVDSSVTRTTQINFWSKTITSVLFPRSFFVEQSYHDTTILIKKPLSQIIFFLKLVTFQYVRWYKENQLLVDSRDSNETPTPERIRLWSNGSLQISQLQPSDTGDYTCALKTDNDTDVTKMHSIIVQYPPTVQTEPEGNIELPIGAVFQVICEARGVPQPKLYWRWNDKLVDNQLIGSRLSIQIEVGSREQSGPIECVANNSIGDIAVAGMFLKVQCKCSKGSGESTQTCESVQIVLFSSAGSACGAACCIHKGGLTQRSGVLDRSSASS